MPKAQKHEQTLAWLEKARGLLATQDHNASLGDGDPQAAAEVIPQSRQQWHGQMEENARYVTTPLDDHYIGEEHNQHDAGHLPNRLYGFDMDGTHYANDAEEFGTDVTGGTLSQRGQTLDSTANKKFWSKDQDERVNFAMDAAGGLYTADPRREFANSLDRDAKTGSRNNHSSLLGGAEAAAAGTMKVRAGKVEEVADGSGHYKPQVAQTHQAVSHLVNTGVMEEARSGVTLTGKGGGQNDIHMSTTELLAYKDEFVKAKIRYAETGDKKELGRPEKTIRKRHATKDEALRLIRDRAKNLNTARLTRLVKLAEPLVGSQFYGAEFFVSLAMDDEDNAGESMTDEEVLAAVKREVAERSSSDEATDDEVSDEATDDEDSEQVYQPPPDLED